MALCRISIRVFSRFGFTSFAKRYQTAAVAPRPESDSPVLPIVVAVALALSIALLVTGALLTRRHWYYPHLKPALLRFVSYFFPAFRQRDFSHIFFSFLAILNFISYFCFYFYFLYASKTKLILYQILIP